MLSIICMFYLRIVLNIMCVLYVSTSCWVWYLCFMSPQNDFPQTVDALNTLATRSRQSPEGYVSILFTHPTPCPFFLLLASYRLYFSSELHPVELSETSCGFLDYIQFPVLAASVKTIVSSEVCSEWQWTWREVGSCLQIFVYSAANQDWSWAGYISDQCANNDSAGASLFRLKVLLQFSWLWLMSA